MFHLLSKGNHVILPLFIFSKRLVNSGEAAKVRASYKLNASPSKETKSLVSKKPRRLNSSSKKEKDSTIKEPKKKTIKTAKTRQVAAISIPSDMDKEPYEFPDRELQSTGPDSGFK